MAGTQRWISSGPALLELQDWLEETRGVEVSPFIGLWEILQEHSYLLDYEAGEIRKKESSSGQEFIAVLLGEEDIGGWLFL